MSNQELHAKRVAFTRQEAAERYPFSVSSLEKATKTGELLGVPAPPYKRAGKTVIYTKEALDNWLESLPEYKHSAEEFVAKQQAQGGAQ